MLIIAGSIKSFKIQKIVFDHFNVIKLMNDKLDKVKRKVSAKLNIIKQKAAKGFAL